MTNGDGHSEQSGEEVELGQSGAVAGRVSSPGDLLAALLRDQDMTQGAFAATIGRPPQMVSEIVTGKKRVTAVTAVQFERVLGLPARVWLALQAEVDLV